MKLLETIKCLDGKLSNIEEHNERFNRSRRRCFNAGKEIHLQDVIEIPGSAKNGLFRCRITYSEKIEKIEFIPHHYREIKTLKLVEGNHIEYGFKFAYRKALDNLFEQRGDCDDILIVKSGLITDSYTANTVFFDGAKWWTPNTPLLAGTQRSRLLGEKKIFECTISPEDILKYTLVGLINAMWDLEELKPIPVANIVY